MLSLVKQLVPFCFAAILAVLLISVLIPLSRKIGLVDYPSKRKQHEGTVPLVGGIAMSVAFALSILLFQTSFSDFRLLFFCIGVLTIIGVLDDQRELDPRMKFLAQFFVALVLTLIGDILVSHLGDIFSINRPLGLSFLAIPFTMISIIGVINAFNMIDGHDGLAGMVALLGLAGLSVLFFFRATPDDHQYLVVIFLLITILIVFLAFNLGIVNVNKKIFLGDAGSMFLGLVMSFLLIRLSQREIPVISTTAAVWIVGLPLLDMISVIVMRILAKVSVLEADRNHIHHFLEQLGLSRNHVLISLTALQSIFVCVGVFGTLLEWPDAVLFWSPLPIVLIYIFLLATSRKRALK